MNPYCIKHKRQTFDDFIMDCHRFSFWYGGKEYEASCHMAVSVCFDNENIPERVQCDVQEEIYKLIDKNESKWSVPARAREIADAYCAENFVKHIKR